MSQKQNSLSLIAPQATGGDTAEGGFQYQINWTIARIPIWLAQDGFTEMIRESLGDVEAKFFVPGIGWCREFVEYKNHLLQPNEFWTEIEDFWGKNQQSPDSYQRFVLACPSVSTGLNSVMNALRRVRDAYPFYEDAQEIQDTSYSDFVEVVKKQNQSKDMADFLLSKVEFEIDLTDAEDRNRELFRETLFKYFPTFVGFSAKVSNAAHSHLMELVRSRKNQPIYRQELEDAIWKEVEEKDKPIIKIHTLHDEIADKGPDGCLQFDWKSIFGGPDRNFPSAEEWNRKVINELQTTKKWVVSTKCPRQIHLSGHRRLSASVAIGSVFSAVSGFTIGMETKDGIYWTNNHPKENTPVYQWQQTLISGESADAIAVGISIGRNIINDVEQYLETILFRGNRLYLLGDTALLSDDHANQAVQKAKLTIQEEVTKTQGKKIHLFLAVPAQFALFFGHRLNTVGKIQCYEWVSPNTYVPTALIQT